MVAMARKNRVKNCHQCHQTAPVLYRIKAEEMGQWIFICPQCWPHISDNNPHYTYGGTWKANKKG